MQQRKIMVLGATGLMGRRLVTRLAARFPDAVIAGAARRATTLSAEFPEGVRLFDVDLEAPETFGEAFAGLTDLVIAVAGRPGRFVAIECQGVVAAANAAFAGGVRRIVHITGTAAPQAPNWFEAGAAKRRAEAAIGMLPGVTTLRPSWLMESLHRFVKDGRMTLIGRGEVAIHWLALDDLVEVVVQVLEGVDVAPAAYPVLGPEAIPLREAAERYARSRGLPDGLRRMPMLLARLVAVASNRIRPVVELTRAFERFDETALAGVETPFAPPPTTLDQWLLRDR